MSIGDWLFKYPGLKRQAFEFLTLCTMKLLKDNFTLDVLFLAAKKKVAVNRNFFEYYKNV